ncbi:MAG: hypothetical protein R3E68_09600 [Burkholderiaceae bacterium]
MIILLRLVFGLGLGLAVIYGLMYLTSGHRPYLVKGFRILVVTLALGLLFFVGVIAEHLFS